MAFDLEFSPEFFHAEGEHYDRPDLALNRKGQPISLYSAICVFIRKNRKGALTAAGIPNHLRPSDHELAETLFEQAQKVNTCGKLTPPVDVWLDSRGVYRVLVYDER
mgnify:CR=1 FL=1